MKKSLYWLVLLAGSIVMLPMTAGAAEYKEKIHYELVQPPQPTTTKDKVEVVEMFWYGCPHCNSLEPYVERWLKRKPDNAEFVRIPAIFARPEWALHARAFYTAEILGVLDKTHSAMFEAIHNQKRNLNSEDALKEFFSEQGVSIEDFDRVFRSFAVEAKVRRAKDLSQRYGIDGVPAVIVDGKYRTSAQLAGGNANIFKVVDYLVENAGK